MGQSPRRRAFSSDASLLAHATPDDVRALLDAAPTGMLLIDANGYIAVANATAAHMLGDPPQGLHGIHVHDALPGCGHDGEQTAVQPDGRLTPIGVEARSVRLAGRDVLLLVLADVAEWRRREHEAARQRDEIAHLSRVAMLGELSGALAHELNQPLATILTNAQAAQRLLRARGAEASQRVLDEILADIVAEGRRAGEVIHRLRQWLRKEHADHVPLVVNEVVIDALHLVRNDLLHRGVDVQLELAGHLPAIDGDRILLQQVLLNFVINGCDAMEDTEGPHLLRVRSRASEDGSVRVDVIDHGHGIDPAILPVMFEPFETTKPGGMGMGLAVCRNIIESHGGRVSARVVPEGGACVGFELPARVQ
ncbi:MULTISPECIES: PAS domain-containing sensor histidine kinase [Lysobacteraceae]|nr:MULTISPECIES: ATP-binding protein [Lysobacter]